MPSPRPLMRSLSILLNEYALSEVLRTWRRAVCARAGRPAAAALPAQRAPRRKDRRSSVSFIWTPWERTLVNRLQTIVPLPYGRGSERFQGRDRQERSE